MLKKNVFLKNQIINPYNYWNLIVLISCYKPIVSNNKNLIKKNHLFTKKLKK